MSQKSHLKPGHLGPTHNYSGEGSRDVDANLALRGSTAYKIIIFCCQEGVARDGHTSSFCTGLLRQLKSKEISEGGGKGKENSFWNKPLQVQS